ncbi:SDR family NAD(P)-dependent oxidoreductase [Vibrio sp. WJH972]
MKSTSIALVTGGAKGIGLACAEALAEDGMQIVIIDIDVQAGEAAAKALGNGAQFLPCNMGNSDEILKTFDIIEEEVGPVSVLVNNAGIARPGEFLDTTIEQFTSVINVNLTGSFIAAQRAAQTMIKHEIAGSIVNMSSVNAKVAIPTISAYCASKGGIMQLTKAMSLSLAPHGIRVNAVGPGSIDTEMMAGVNANPEAMKMVMSRTPLKRIGNPREIGDVVAFLASKKASYISGETIYVDGGRLGMNYTC